ncbi:MAG: diacylglycerol kinase family lipid kinase [Bacteroidetes bacterium]|uniref:Diacylglycerol kinase family lipid kinase n=1 Tax=Candidatus Cryptobacteroides avistercoris TaxID=2840758 RepID=A0A9D9NPB6_9BACT|nr:diacylglycerol kinase family lipid kinase [Candidatus Cryptobacteroides avistercoris]
MTESKTDCYFFIVNPRAGSGKTMFEWLPAERKLKRLGIPCDIAMTDHKRHATALAYEAASKGYRKIIAVGGDGSLHETFNGICRWCARTGTPTEEFLLGVVPIGSGNDWIRSLGVPNDTSEVVDLIRKNSVGVMDVVRVKSSGGRLAYMANIGGVGFDSHVCKRVNIQKESGRRGKMIYLNSLRYTIFNLKPVYISVVADGEVIFTGQCFSVALGNGRYSGSGMRQVPLAVMDDGLLDYAVIPKAPLAKVLKELPRLFSGTLNQSEYVISGKCRSLQIVPMDEQSADIFELDGEIEGLLPMSVEITGHQINVIKGENA